MVDTAGPQGPPTQPRNPDANGDPLTPPHDAVGAYVLDALPVDERRAFELHLADCPSCRQGVAELEPVVSLLARRYDDGPDALADEAPSPDLGRRIVAAALARPNTAAPPTTAETPRPQPVQRAAPTVLGADRVVPLKRSRGIASGWPVAAALALFAAGAVVWGLSLRMELDARQAELTLARATVEGQSVEIEQLRQRAATAFALAPTDAGPSAAHGNLLYADRDQFGILYVGGLPELPPGQDYQLWYFVGEAPLPSGTFEVNADGVGSLALTDNVTDAKAVALTIEPDGGSQAPTSDPLLLGAAESAIG